jgi:hypothetical protein
MRRSAPVALALCLAWLLAAAPGMGVNPAEKSLVRRAAGGVTVFGNGSVVPVFRRSTTPCAG